MPYSTSQRTPIGHIATVVCCCLICPWVGVLFTLLALLSFAYEPNGLKNGPEGPKTSAEIASMVLFWLGVSVLVFSLCFTCVYMLRRVLPAVQKGSFIGVDCTKMSSLIGSAEVPFYPLASNDGGGLLAPGLRYAHVGAQLCNYIYDPLPKRTILVNESGIDVVIVFKSNWRRTIIPAGGKRELHTLNFEQDGKDQEEITVTRTLVDAVSSANKSIILTAGVIKFKHTYRVVAATKEHAQVDGESHLTTSSVRLELVEHSALPAGCKVLHIEYSHEADEESHRKESIVQWAIVTPSAQTDVSSEVASVDDGVGTSFEAWIVFRGTQNLADMAIDIGCAPIFVHSLGLRVHSGMWAALHTQSTSVLENILETLQEKVLQNHGRKTEIKLVVFGHSLGGGYALLTALELLSQSSCINIVLQDVVTFGAPMVIIPAVDNPFWRSLQSSATLFVNAWDAFPRMPSVESWIFDVLPHPLVCSSFVPSKEMVEHSVRPVWSTVAAYDACGTLAFIDAMQPGSVMCVLADGNVVSGPHRVVLEAVPEIPGKFVIGHHNRYVPVTKLLESVRGIHKLHSDLEDSDAGEDDDDTGRSDEEDSKSSFDAVTDGSGGGGSWWRAHSWFSTASAGEAAASAAPAAS